MSAWLGAFRQLAEDLIRSLPTSDSFSKNLEDLVQHPDSPIRGLIRGLTFEWECGDAGEAITVGKPVGGAADHHERRPQVPCTLRIWARTGEGLDLGTTSISLPDVAREAWICFDAFWCANERSAKSGLRDLKNSPRIAQQAAERFARSREQNGRCSFLFFDLDGFKEVNEQIDYPQGDIVIRHFAQLLERACGGSATPLHNGGDEFVVLFPDADAEDAMDLALDVIARGKEFDFESCGIPIGISAGVTSHPDIDDYESLSDFMGAAESALKREVKAKAKGTARFPATTTGPRPPTSQATKLAVCLMKSSLAAPRIRTFASPWLNILATRVSRALMSQSNGNTVAREVDRFLEAAQLEVDSSVLGAQHPRGREAHTTPVVSLVDFGFAVASGFFYAAARQRQIEEEIGGLIIKSGANGIRLQSKTGHVLWSLGSVPTKAQKIDLGSCWQIDQPESVDEEASRLAVLVQIGHERPEVPDGILADRIVIDDRPTRGGGLPDFWELTLARILDSLESHPNVSKVFVMGNPDWGKESIEWLTGTERWNARFIEYKTTLSPGVIEEGKERLSGNVCLSADLDKLLEVLDPEVQAHRSLVPAPKVTALAERRRFLQREINLRIMALEPEDGCRVATVAQAYPVVLEILRRPGGDKEIIMDQAGQQLRELVDFRVELTDPLKNMVPAFYMGEEKQLQEYYQREFRDAEGIFSKKLQETINIIAS